MVCAKSAHTTKHGFVKDITQTHFVEYYNVEMKSFLFAIVRDVKTIRKYINNALNEEILGESVVAKFATTRSDGKTYQIEH